jgi:spore coat polysaccharide biosynthesis predicted glycosyltransferase SpsG
MTKSHFAIITPSVTANEVYYLGLPFVAIQTADNQTDMYRYLKRKNHLALKKFDEKKFCKIVERLK